MWGEIPNDGLEQHSRFQLTSDPGNGAATARVFTQQGSKVFGCDLNLESAQHTKKKIEAEGGEIEVITADVTKSDQCKALVDACMKKYGRIDVLVK